MPDLVGKKLTKPHGNQKRAYTADYTFTIKERLDSKTY